MGEKRGRSGWVGWGGRGCVYVCGGGGADVWLYAHVYPYVHAACNELKKWASTSVLAPSTGLTSRKKPHTCSLRRQTPSVPDGKITQPRVEEKDCEARPPHPPLLRRKGGAIFSISSALDAQDPEICEKMHLDVSSWLAGPFYPPYHSHPGDDQEQ